MIYPLWNVIEELIAGTGLSLVDINTDIASYHRKALYSLDKVFKKKNESLNLNRYQVDVSLTIVTKTDETTVNHTQLVLELLSKIEQFDADLFVSLETSPSLVINGSEYKATLFNLTTETLHFEELL